MKSRPFLSLLAVILLPLVLSTSGCSKANPLSVVQRDSLVGEGKVLVITNTSDDYLHDCTIEISGRGSESYGPEIFTPTLNPHESTEVGWLQLGNWKLEPGEKVTLSAKGYRSLSKTISE